MKITMEIDLTKMIIFSKVKYHFTNQNKTESVLQLRKNTLI